jgi:hypothetical protein
MCVLAQYENKFHTVLLEGKVAVVLVLAGGFY